MKQSSRSAFLAKNTNSLCALNTLLFSGSASDTDTLVGSFTMPAAGRIMFMNTNTETALANSRVLLKVGTNTTITQATTSQGVVNAVPAYNYQTFAEGDTLNIYAGTSTGSGTLKAYATVVVKFD